ncbi:MAG TPA: glycosyltransferase [Gemmatimonadaceae bacterium]|nr:glycosyltransferase [Gemmatimonadaceae bacterium]
MADKTAPDLSIVIASINPGPVLLDTLAALEQQCGFRAEVIVVDASNDDTSHLVRVRFPWVRVIDSPETPSFPKLRGIGIAESRGAIVGVLDAWCLMSDRWVTAAIRAHGERGHVAIGGGVDLERYEREHFSAWATYLFDYWEFVPPFPEGAVGVLSGNNITYKRSALPEPDVLRRDGFWKSFVNSGLKQNGAEFWAAPALTVRLRRRLPLGAFLRSRFHHGRSYAAMRTRGASFASRVGRAATTPALPFVFFWRQFRGLAGKSGARGWLLRTTFAMLAFHASWAFGEFCGYLTGAGRSDDAIQS